MLFILSIYFLFNQRIPQRSTGITHNDPWILDESDSSDDEEVALALFSKDVERQIILANGLHINYSLGFLECACRLYIYCGNIEDLLHRIRTFVYRVETPPCDEVLDVATLLRNHITTTVLLTKTVVFIIRRSKPWKSFMREMMQHKVDDPMDFEIFSFRNFHCSCCNKVRFNRMHKKTNILVQKTENSVFLRTLAKRD